MIDHSLRHIVGAAIVAVALGGAIDARPANAQGTFIYGMPIDHSILDPHVMAALFVGAMLPFLFSALSMQAVGRAAQRARRSLHRGYASSQSADPPQYDPCCHWMLASP
ncbi:MAG: sodium/proton-translocating pyrophosphatase [Gemmatimonadetes bacterium]|nr:sodium/proton-translocating pyrophosphatase [Gemmatimonadota bacterium]